MLELGPKMAGLYHITIEQAYLKAEIVGDNVKLQVKIRLLKLICLRSLDKIVM